MNEQTRSLVLDIVTLIGELPASKDSYAAAFSPLLSESAGTVELDMHGAGRFELTQKTSLSAGSEGASTLFPGYIVTYVLAQPSEVQAVTSSLNRERCVSA